MTQPRFPTLSACESGGFGLLFFFYFLGSVLTLNLVEELLLSVPASPAGPPTGKRIRFNRFISSPLLLGMPRNFLMSRIYTSPITTSPPLPRQSIFTYLFPSPSGPSSYPTRDPDAPLFIDGLIAIFRIPSSP